MNLQKVLPYDRRVLTTKLSAEEASAKVMDIIKPLSGGSYQGNLFENSFEIRRIIGYGNSFLPVIKGRISTFAGLTEIAVEMRPSVFVLVFMYVWLGLVGIICLGILRILWLHPNKVSPPLLIPFGMFIFGYGMLMIAYKIESKKSMAFLKTLLEAE